jgi:hypothetical protein
MVNFKRSALPNEITFFTAIIALSFLFWSLALFFYFPLKTSLSFSERRIDFPIYFVGVPSRFALEVGVLVISLIFLKPFFKIVVETCGCRD